MDQFEPEFLSPASAKTSVPSALNFCRDFFNAEDAKKYAKFAENPADRWLLRCIASQPF